MRTKPSADDLSFQASPIQTGISRILQELGEDTRREGLRDTPKRYEKAMRFLTSGYQADIRQIVGNALFQEEADGIVVVRDIELSSLCEHHLLPFMGKAHVAYLPRGRVIGLSKIPRIVDAFARRLQVQERLTAQVADSLMGILEPAGVLVSIEAHHMCMVMRGVQKQMSTTTTLALRGCFKTDREAERNALALIQNSKY